MGKLKHTLLLIGGFTGFSVAFAASMAAGNGIDRMLLDGAIGLAVGFFLFKWLAELFLGSFREARRKARLSATTAVSQGSPARPPAPGMTGAAMKAAANNLIKNIPGNK